MPRIGSGENEPMTAPPKATNGERLAKLEATFESLVRTIGDIKADIREMRAMMRMYFLITVGVKISSWLAAIALLLVILFRM